MLRKYSFTKWILVGIMLVVAGFLVSVRGLENLEVKELEIRAGVCDYWKVGGVDKQGGERVKIKCDSGREYSGVMWERGGQNFMRIKETGVVVVLN